MVAQITSDANQQDDFFLDTPAMRAFIADVRRALAANADVPACLATLRPHFAALLADQSWLPDEFAQPYAASGMGGGIGSWLLFRAADRSLSLFSLVVPSGAETPVHDHLAWGFVGLYRGEQAETVYRRTDDGSKEDSATLEVVQVNALQPGDLYTLLPPEGDIHAVRTTSAEASISIHLLANDTGCVVRHAFEPRHARVRAFRSGYSNVACAADDGSRSG
ncbi:MAG TPA: cysteine dioxygenase family protein [Roseiflexaceae bacterium]|nr:cysteine dioxygenase family protein [Roseiflexaceae bacterium]